MEQRPGSYAVLLRSDAAGEITVGRRGCLGVVPGDYVYVGSALGPGGVAARVSRHLRGGAAKHWHVDYLRAVTRPVCAWVSYEPRNQEHRWARVIAGLPGAQAVPGFGCSDCRCSSHLVLLDQEPEVQGLARALGAEAVEL